MTEQWIKEAFDKAKIDAEKSKSVADTISRFLDENTPLVLKKWSQIVGEDKAIAFAKELAKNPELNEMVETLTGVFTVAGYLLAVMEQNNQFRK